MKSCKKCGGIEFYKSRHCKKCKHDFDAKLKSDNTSKFRLCNAKASAAYHKKYPEKNSASVMRYKAAQLNATPIWANKFIIDEIYHLARIRTKSTGFKWHVDHIIPLRNKIVCGLHTELNLNVIPATLNLKKGSTFASTYP